MPSTVSAPSLLLLTPPYSVLRPVTGGRPQLKREGRFPGSALVWQMAAGIREQDVSVVTRRPGGLALVALLPPSAHLPSEEALAKLVAAVRPHTLLPAHPDPRPDELTWALRRPPEDLGVEVTEYLIWRGLSIDRDTARLIRRTLDASAELRSISGLSRSLYLSRRALGRRFMSRGLPVPSHWLHLGRLLRVAIRLQNSDESVLSVGYELGYPDGFSVSNQMMRLVGCRPSEARECLGWEWILEAWLRREADTGGLTPELTTGILGEAEPQAASPPAPPSRAAPRPRDDRRRVAG